MGGCGFAVGVLVGFLVSSLCICIVIYTPAIDTIGRFDSGHIFDCNELAAQFNEMRVGIPMTNLTHRVNAGEFLFHCECTTGNDAERVHYPDVVASQDGSRVIPSEIFCTPIGRH